MADCLSGYHCCLFAYGQTGSGKSYSMMGTPENRGMIPTSLESLFQESKKGENKQVQVKMSMLEIYNERVQDLLIEERGTIGLKVREHKEFGVYVEGLSKYACASFSEVEGLIATGSRNRSIASTLMNSTSSRAHTIVRMEIKQLTLQEEGGTLEIDSVISPGGLAGSGRVGKTGPSRVRLKDCIVIVISVRVG